MITTFIITIISLLIGYWIGHSTKPIDDVKSGFTKLMYKGQDLVKDIKYRNIKVGIVQRPDAKRIYELNHPEIEEEKEEMRKSLKEGIKPLTP